MAQVSRTQKQLKKKPTELSWFIIVAVLAVGFLVLSIGTPLNYDDWAWGGALGMSRFHKFYRDYNGRYAGNTVELAVTRFPLIRYSFMTICSTLFALSFALLTKTKQKLSVILCTVFILFMPTTMFCETFSWVAGYVNYIPGMLFALWALIYMRWVLQPVGSTWFENDKWSGWTRILRIVFIFVVFLGAEWFVENTSIFISVIAGITLIITIVHKRALIPESLAFAVSSVAGTVIMFSNGAYQKYANGGAYKQVNLGGGIKTLIANCWSGYVERVAKIAVYRNVVLFFTLTVIAVYLLFANTKLKLWLRWLLTAFMVFFWALLFFDNYIIRSTECPLVGWSVMSVLSLVYLLIILIVCVLSTNKMWKNVYYVLIAVSWAVAIGPMLVTMPCHNRSLLLSYVVLMTLIASMLEECRFNQKTLNMAQNSVGLLTACAMLIMSYMFICNRVAYEQKVDYVIHNKGASEITLPNLPYPDYVYKGNQDRITEIFDREFKLYYNLDQDMNISLIPYDQWKEERK